MQPHFTYTVHEKGLPLPHQATSQPSTTRKCTEASILPAGPTIRVPVTSHECCCSGRRHEWYGVTDRSHEEKTIRPRRVPDARQGSPRAIGSRVWSSSPSNADDFELGDECMHACIPFSKGKEFKDGNQLPLVLYSLLPAKKNVCGISTQNSCNFLIYSSVKRILLFSFQRSPA